MYFGVGLILLLVCGILYSVLRLIFLISECIVEKGVFH